MAVATVFKSREDISPDWVTYIEVEADALSRLSDYEIENYADRELYNPEVQSFLKDWKDDGGDDYLLAPSRWLAVTYPSMKMNKEAAQMLGLRLGRLKEKVRKVFCKIVSELAGDGKIDWDDVIKAILIALIPVLGGGVWAAVAVPVIVMLIAKLIKYGIGAVCPV